LFAPPRTSYRMVIRKKLQQLVVISRQQQEVSHRIRAL